MTESLYNKILNEYFFLAADKFEIENKGSNLRLYLIKCGKKIKSYKLHPSRAEELAAFLKNQETLSGNNNTAVNPAAEKHHHGHVPVVLIVEDDPDQRKILDMMLKDLKYHVLHAQNGEEALTQAADNTPDLIITDIMMPKMDGIDFIKKIKRNPAYQNIPVLVLTVLSDPDKEYALLKLGIDDYCQKTMQRNILMKRIENLVNRHLQFP